MDGTVPRAAPPAGQTASPPAADDSRRIGRGALLLFGTKAWFIVSSYVLVAILPRILRKDDYGDYATASGVAVILSQCVFQGTMFAVSRFVGADQDGAGAVLAAATRLQLVVGGVLFLILEGLAGVLASRVYKSPALVWPIRVAGLIVLLQAFYAVFLGSLNGLKEFRRQATADLAYSTSKVLLIPLGAVLVAATGIAGRVTGAVVGFAAAGGVALVLALALVPRKPRSGTCSARRLFEFQLATMGFAALTTLVIQVQVQLLRALSPGGESFLKNLAADYDSANKLAQMPYTAVIALTLVMFPVVSGRASRGGAGPAGAVREALRWTVLIAAIAAALFAACPEETIRLLFPKQFGGAAPTLRILAPGYVAFAAFFVLASALSAAGRPGLAVLLVALVVAIQLPLTVAFVAWLGMGPRGAAAAATTGMIAGAVAAAAATRRILAASLPFASLARFALAAGAIGALAAFGVPRALGSTGGAVRGGLTVTLFGVLFILYLGGLAAAREFTPEDRARMRRVFGR